MKIQSSALFLVAVLMMSGCATQQEPELPAELQPYWNTALYCEGDAECKKMWERATYFVNANAGFKLQILNDNVIETYNPPHGNTNMAFSISKEPMGDGKYRIWTKVWCGNMFGCSQPINETIARAKRYMKTGIQ